MIHCWRMASMVNYRVPIDELPWHAVWCVYRIPLVEISINFGGRTSRCAMGTSPLGIICRSASVQPYGCGVDHNCDDASLRNEAYVDGNCKSANLAKYGDARLPLRRHWRTHGHWRRKRSCHMACVKMPTKTSCVTCMSHMRSRSLVMPMSGSVWMNIARCLAVNKRI